MPLTENNRKDIVAYRKEKSLNTFHEAEAIKELGFWSLCANRLYYSVFYACSALLINYGHSALTHNGVRKIIGMEFISTGKLDKKYSDLLQRLFSMRHTGDYDDGFDWDQKDVLPLFGPTKEFIDTIFDMLSE